MCSLLLLQMLAEEAGKFHHIDRVFANDFGEGSVGNNAPFIGGVLEIVGLVKSKYIFRKNNCLCSSGFAITCI